MLKLIEDDELGLLNIKQKKSSMLTADERLVASFHAINDFVSKNGREPEYGNEMNEHQLYARLNGIRESKEKIKALLDLDEYGLLQQKVKEVKSINDILDDDTLGLLDSGAESIFKLRHIPKETTMPDYIASRKPCKDFEKYKDKFIQCQIDLRAGTRKLWPFKQEQQIDKGLFFVLKGILLYIADVGAREVIAGRTNARLHCIFENGTESDMLLRSLAAELYKNGRRVTDYSENLIVSVENSENEDVTTGYIYVLKSLSTKPEIQSISNLYKIGFSRVPIEERIKNAAMEPTYLMAAVSIVSGYQCYNINPQKLEQLLHKFFGSACLNLDVFDNDGRRHIPREWFIAPVDIIEQAILFVLNGDIVNYRYDVEKQIIVGR